jgi:hypothetical protein
MPPQHEQNRRRAEKPGQYLALGERVVVVEAGHS